MNQIEAQTNHCENKVLKKIQYCYVTTSHEISLSDFTGTSGSKAKLEHTQAYRKYSKENIV